MIEKGIVCLLVAASCLYLRPIIGFDNQHRTQMMTPEENYIFGRRTLTDFINSEEVEGEEMDKGDSFWESSPASANSTDSSGGGMAHAGHAVNASEAANNTNGRVYFNPLDIPKIERFFKTIVKESSSMYEGTWIVNEEDAMDPKGILSMAFGLDDKSSGEA